MHHTHSPFQSEGKRIVCWQTLNVLSERGPKAKYHPLHREIIKKNKKTQDSSIIFMFMLLCYFKSFSRSIFLWLAVHDLFFCLSWNCPLSSLIQLIGLPGDGVQTNYFPILGGYYFAYIKRLGFVEALTMKTSDFFRRIQHAAK